MSVNYSSLNIKNLIPGNNMRVTYRSYCDFSNNSSSKVDIITMDRMLYEIDYYYNLLDMDNCYYDKDFIYRNEDIDEIKYLLLSGNYKFSPLYEISDSYTIINKNEWVVPNIYISKADNFVFSVLRRILVKGLSTYYRKSCYSKCNDNIDNRILNYNLEEGYINLLNTISDWKNVNGIIHISCERCIELSSRSRIIEKLSPILDPDLQKLISSYFDLYIIDEKGNNKTYEFAFESKILHNYHKSLRNELINILLDDVDKIFELQYRQYARYYNEIFIGIRNDIFYNHSIINNIFNQFNIKYPYFKYIHKGGDNLILDINREIKINKDGVCEIINNKDRKTNKVMTSSSRKKSNKH